MMARGRMMALTVLALATAACAPATDESVNEETNVAAEAQVEPANAASDTGAVEADNMAVNATAEPAANAAAVAAAKVEAEAEAARKAAADEAGKAEELAKKKADDEAREKLAAAAVVPPPATFARCAVCHDATKGGPNKLGPNLYGTYGKSAGVHAGFRYSDALKGAGLKWDDATLDKWLENPRALVPGNSMSFPGLKDAAKRQELIAYLKSLK